MYQPFTGVPGGSRRHRSTRLVALLMSLAFVAAACAGDDGDDTATGGATTTTAASTATTAPSGPSGVQELIVGAAADPWVDASEGDKKRIPNYPLNADVCETPVRLETDFDVVPMVTTAEFVGDNTFRFTLVEGVTFSDGTPVTVEDLKYSFDYTTQEPNISGLSALDENSAVIVDDKSVDLTATKPNLRIVEQVNHPTYAILKQGSDPLNDPEGSICTGPFVVESYTPDEELVVVRNENFWGEAPALDKITFKFYPEATTRALALQNGEVDLILDVPLEIYESVASQPGVKIAEAPVGNNHMFYIARRTVDGTPRVLDDDDVRRAVAHAIDKDAYINGLLGGHVAAVDALAPPAVFGPYADMIEGIPYDPDEAERLLDEAGWTRDGDGPRTKDGETLTVTIIFARLPLSTAEFVQAELEKVGFDAKVDQLDGGAYRDATSNGTYDIDISLPNQNNGNPAFLQNLRWYSKATGRNVPIITPGPGTRFDELIDQTLVTDDFDELRRLSAEAMQELVNVEVGGVSLAGGYRVYAMKDKVMGFEPHPSNTNLRWRTVFIQE